MSSQLLSWSLLILWVFSQLGVFAKPTEIKNVGVAQPPVRNGWQPLIGYDNDGNASPPDNYAAYTFSYFESEKDRSYKPSKQRRKQSEAHQYDYPPPSILGSFSIFGHALPKNRNSDETKNNREGTNTNEYDFLVPPPRQKIEPYQKIKVNSDVYPVPSQYREIYTPLNNQFTFIPTAPAAPPAKKHPFREEAAYPPRQYPTAVESHKLHHAKPPWQNVRDDPYHVFRPHPPNEEIINGNRYYTQISHPPIFKSPYEIQNAKRNYSDFATPGNLHVVQPSSSQRNEFVAITTTTAPKIIPHYVEPAHYLFQHNAGNHKQTVETTSGNIYTGLGTVNKYFNIHRPNATTTWPLSSTPVNSAFSEVLPKFNKPVQFNSAIPSQVYNTEIKLNSRIVPERIHPQVPKPQYETPESISLKHFNEQQFLLQQQLLERDRQQLEQLRNKNNAHLLKIDKEKVNDSLAPVRTAFDNEFQVYESVKLTNEKGTDRQPSSTRNHENYSTQQSQIFELPFNENATFSYHPEPPNDKATEASAFAGKKKKANHHRIIVESVANEYDREVYSSKHYPDAHRETDASKPSKIPPTVLPEFVAETSPIVTTPAEQPTRTPPQKSAAQYEESSTWPTEPERTAPIVTDVTTRKSTTKTRSRGSTRRRRPIIEADPSTSSSTEPTSSGTVSTTEFLNYPRYRSTTSATTEHEDTRDAEEHVYRGKRPTVQENQSSTASPSDPVTGDTRYAETTEYPSTSAQSSSQYAVESTSPLSHTIIHYPEESTTRTSERLRTTTRDYSYSIAPLENLFNFTSSTVNQVSSTQGAEWTASVDHKGNNVISNSSETIEATTRSSYRLRPMKFANSTRPRFSVKDYRSRLDYKSRQSTTTESGSTPAVSVKSKGTGKYKYTPRQSYTKSKSSTASYAGKNAENTTEAIEVKRKISSAQRVFNANMYRRGVNSTVDATGDVKSHQNISRVENRFIQPIRRRPPLKTSAQLAQMIKRNKHHSDQPIRGTKVPPTTTIELTQLKSDTEELAETSTIVESDITKIKLKNTTAIINTNSSDTPKGEEKIIAESGESTTIPAIAKETLQHTSVQSDEEVFAKASQSVADLTSSASALYNQPGMFKALSSMPYYESEMPKKSFKPTMDEPSLPIEEFFREISNKE